METTYVILHVFLKAYSILELPKKEQIRPKLHKLCSGWLLQQQELSLQCWSIRCQTRKQLCSTGICLLLLQSSYNKLLEANNERGGLQKDHALVLQGSVLSWCKSKWYVICIRCQVILLEYKSRLLTKMESGLRSHRESTQSGIMKYSLISQQRKFMVINDLKLNNRYTIRWCCSFNKIKSVISWRNHETSWLP